MPGQSGHKELRFSTCCRHGALKDVPVLPPAPTPLAQLIGAMGGHAKSTDFHRDIRAYNGSLAFASFSDSRARGPNPGRQPGGARGPPVFILHGRAYHVAGTLYPHDGAPKFAQLYVYDPQEATEHRAGSFPQLDAQVLRELLDMLLELSLIHI